MAGSGSSKAGSSGVGDELNADDKEEKGVGVCSTIINVFFIIKTIHFIVAELGACVQKTFHCWQSKTKRRIENAIELALAENGCEAPSLAGRKCDIDCFFDVMAESPPDQESSPQAQHEEEDERSEEKEEASKAEGVFMRPRETQR